MWENVIAQLNNIAIATGLALGISEILESVQASLSTLVPYDTANKPHLKVSNIFL